MTVSVYLLGRPRVVRDNGDAPRPKGRKPWALLTYLLLGDRPPFRGRLASLFFPEADDPLAALRWNLAEVRRLLGPGMEVGGDPVALHLPPGTFADVLVLQSGTWLEVEAIPGLGSDLLQGLDFSSSPAFEAWLTAERRRMHGLASAMLREAAQLRLAAGDERGAVQTAARLVELDPLDENHHILFVRALALAGDREAANRQVAACTDLFRQELGTSPTSALTEATKARRQQPKRVPGGRVAVLARIQAGEAALATGAVETGWECLGRAAADAAGLDDPRVRTQALLSLGAALIHAVRGRDEEGASVLHEALLLAEAYGEWGLAASALRELAYVDLLRGHYERVQSWLQRARDRAGEDLAEQARIAGLLGMSLCDTGRYPEAIEALSRSIDLARAVDDVHQVAQSLSHLGRAHLLRGELSLAIHVLDQSLALVRAEHWTGFYPWVECLRAEADLLEGRVSQAGEAFQHAFALASELNDPCWEGASLRGLGLVDAARGDLDGAVGWLMEARRRAFSDCDTYQWMHAYILDALCDLAVTHDLPSPGNWISHLEALAERSGMREFVVRAQLYRAHLGRRGSVIAAAFLADAVDSPALQARLDSLMPVDYGCH